MKPEEPERKADSEKRGEEHVEVPVYEALAGIYDHVMSHVDYLSWADFAMEILTAHGMPPAFEEPPPYLLECGCGTGTVASLLASNGCIVDAFDRSPAMIEVAKSKARSSVTSPKFWVDDLLSLELEDRYDAVICLYDSVNYLTETSEISDFFKRVHRALRPNGLFLFDICTEYNSKRYFASHEESDEGSGFSYHRTTCYHDNEMIQENSFVIRLESEPGKVFIERHFQRIYRLGTIRDILSGANMVILEETNAIYREPPVEESIRVHFLCQRC